MLVKQYLEFKQIPYTLAYGSLLGAARNGGFIPHDSDIDLYLSIKYDGMVAEMGKLFEIKTIYTEVKGNIPQKLRPQEGPDKADIDFFNERVQAFLKANKMPKDIAHGNLLKLSIFRNKPRLTTLKFCGVDFPAPENYIDILKRVYGDNCLTHVYPGYLPTAEYKTKPIEEFLTLEQYAKTEDALEFVQPDLNKFKPLVSMTETTT